MIQMVMYMLLRVAGLVVVVAFVCLVLVLFTSFVGLIFAGELG